MSLGVVDLDGFGHVEREELDNWVSACRHMVVERVRGRSCGRPMKTWRECADEDIVT
jgi:hypothetical protein